jgi:integrase
LKDHATHSHSKQSLFNASRPILKWWAGKKLDDVNGTRCRAYVRWRLAQGVGDQTARRDLKIMKAAVRWFKKEHDPSLAVPTVTLPDQAPQRKDYWLTRDEVAARLRVSRKSRSTHHIARLILIGVYSGTRSGAMLALSWLPSLKAGWFDLDAGVLHRVGQAVRQTNKRQPPARIHTRLLPHLRRWRGTDMERGITSVIHYKGKPVVHVRHAWNSIATRVNATGKDGPHILRHTCATWLMQAGVDAFEAAGFLGMSPKTLWEVYGHHHPSFQSNAATAVGRRTRTPGGQVGGRLT